MTRSIFDPAGGETERSGSVFTPPDADQVSHLPPEIAGADLLAQPEPVAEGEAGPAPEEEVSARPSAELKGEENFSGKAARGIDELIENPLPCPPPAPHPGLELDIEEDGRLLVVRLAGRLHAGDYALFAPDVDEAIRRHGRVRMLVEMHDFHGWDCGALWENVKFDAAHFNDIERLAIVGDRRWEHGMALLCRPFTTATVRFFPANHVADARAWVAADHR